MLTSTRVSNLKDKKLLDLQLLKELKDFMKLKLRIRNVKLEKTQSLNNKPKLFNLRLLHQQLKEFNNSNNNNSKFISKSKRLLENNPPAPAHHLPQEKTIKKEKSLYSMWTSISVKTRQESLSLKSQTLRKLPRDSSSNMDLTITS